MADQPNVLAVGLSVLRSRRVSPPGAQGTASLDSGGLADVLHAVRAHGPLVLADHSEAIDSFIATMSAVHPDQLDRSHAQAFWLNMYNAGALRTVVEAYRSGTPTVLRIPGAFSKPFVSVEGEDLSLDDIEHGKIRRFGDPRIHAALICGSASCPSLRAEPFDGGRLDAQLDDQMRSFLAAGAATPDLLQGTISLSRIFLWYGRDFTRPDLMPGFGVASASRVRDTVAHWLPAEVAEAVWSNRPPVSWQTYDWALGCSVA